MRAALTVCPGVCGSAAMSMLPEPELRTGEVLVASSLVGVCGTDREIVAGHYGQPEPGAMRLVIGHEAVGTVLTGTGDLQPGSTVVPIVRHPDPAPCPNCAVGEWDMCRNGLFTEHGIKGRDGFATERFVTTVDHVVPLPPALGNVGTLVEPASIVAKAWEQIDRLAGRAHDPPRTVLITGAGPVGLIAALLARQRGLDTHVLDLVDDGPKPRLAADLGATYHSGPLGEVPIVPDIVVECTGHGSVVLDAIERTSTVGIVCLTGLSTGHRDIPLDASRFNRRIVLENDIVFGTVNANRRHYLAAIKALAAADLDWVDRLITRRVPLRSFAEALRVDAHDVKVVLEVGP